MKIAEILKNLTLYDGTFPREALEAAIALREEITPELLGILEHATENIEALYHQEDYMAHIYAMFLLAQFREKRAYPLIVGFFSIPGEITLDVTGDFVTEDLGRVLASVSHGDMSLITSLAENEEANGYVRDAALNALVTMVACGEKTRDEIMAYFQRLFREKLSRTPSHVWGGLISCSLDLYPEEVYEDIKQAFSDNLVDEMFVDLEYVDMVMAGGKSRALQAAQTDHHHKLVKDTIKELEWWACFQPSLPQRRKTAQVGRNAPCPCGSGKKYKRCCGKRS